MTQSQDKLSHSVANYPLHFEISHLGCRYVLKWQRAWCSSCGSCAECGLVADTCQGCSVDPTHSIRSAETKQPDFNRES